MRLTGGNTVKGLWFVNDSYLEPLLDMMEIRLEETETNNTRWVEERVLATAFILSETARFDPGCPKSHQFSIGGGGGALRWLVTTPQSGVRSLHALCRFVSETQSGQLISHTTEEWFGALTQHDCGGPSSRMCASQDYKAVRRLQLRRNIH